MKTNPFKVGDRVSVSGYCAPNLCVFYHKKRGTIQAISTGGVQLNITLDDEIYVNVYAHTNQCRHIKKKQRRRIFVSEGALKMILEQDHEIKGIKSSRDNRMPNMIEFAEVKKK